MNTSTMENRDENSDDYSTVSESEYKSSEESESELVERTENLSETEEITDDTLETTKRPLLNVKSNVKLSNTNEDTTKIVYKEHDCPKKRIEITVKDVTKNKEEFEQAGNRNFKKASPKLTVQGIKPTSETSQRWEHDLYNDSYEKTNTKYDHQNNRSFKYNNYSRQRHRNIELNSRNGENENNYSKQYDSPQKQYLQEKTPTSRDYRTRNSDKFYNTSESYQERRIRPFKRESKVSDNFDYRIAEGVIDKISVIQIKGDDTEIKKTPVIVSDITKLVSERKQIEKINQPLKTPVLKNENREINSSDKAQSFLKQSNMNSAPKIVAIPLTQVDQPNLQFTNANSHPTNSNHRQSVYRYPHYQQNMNPRPFNKRYNQNSQPGRFPVINQYNPQNLPAHYGFNYTFMEPSIYPTNMMPSVMDPNMYGCYTPMQYHQPYPYDVNYPTYYSYPPNQYGYMPQNMDYSTNPQPNIDFGMGMN